MRLVLIFLGCAVLLTGCMQSLLVAENRDGVVVFLRESYISRQASDTTAEKYCGQRQKPSTWISTKMTKTGNYHDTYKCGTVPPAQMSILRKEQSADESLRQPRSQPERPAYRERETPPSSVSGDYFRSRRGDSNNDW